MDENVYEIKTIPAWLCIEQDENGQIVGNFIEREGDDPEWTVLIAKQEAKALRDELQESGEYYDVFAWWDYEVGCGVEVQKTRRSKPKVIRTWTVYPTEIPEPYPYEDEEDWDEGENFEEENESVNEDVK